MTLCALISSLVFSALFLHVVAENLTLGQEKTTVKAENYVDDVVNSTESSPPTVTVVNAFEEVFESLNKSLKAATSTAADDFDEQRLIGGTAITAIAAYPYAAEIKSTNADGTTIYCGATILNNRYVLTAAQCVYQASTIEVMTGVTDVTSLSTTTPTPTPVKGIATIYPGFRRYCLIHDIALVKLFTGLSFGTGSTGPVTIPWGSKAHYSAKLDNFNLRTIGFGAATSTATDTPTTLKFVDQTQIDTSTCATMMLDKFVEYPPGVSCLESSSGTLGACVGDLGSPVLYKFPSTSRYVLVGVVTDNTNCATSYPTGYTRIAPYLTWIASYIKDLTLLH